MRSDLIYTSTLQMNNNDWLLFRDRGIGASDVSTILHLNDYKSALELFHEKIGNKQNNFKGSFRAFMGHQMEDLIARYWTHWDGCKENIEYNYNNNIVFRKMQKVNAYIQNPDYPHLFVSLDRKINKHNGRDEGALELKTISGWEAKKWKTLGLPLGYLIQVLTQMLVCDFEYGELAYMEDFNDFNVLPIEPRENLKQAIIQETTDFWDRVEKGRILMTQRYEAEQSFNMKLYQEIDAEISQLEPSVDDSDKLADFLNDFFGEVKKGMLQGDDALYLKAVEHKKIKESIKELNNQAILIENLFKQKIRDRTGIDFGEKGCIYWNENVNKTRIFRNRVVY